MTSEKSINAFEMKKDRLPDYLWDNISFWQFVYNLSLLLCKIYVFDFFNMVNFFQIFVISREVFKF